MSQQIDVEKVLLQELMEDSPDYVFIKDRESRFVITNKAHAQRLLGLANPADAVGKTDFDLFPEKKADAQRFYDEEQSIIKTGQPVLRREWMVPSTATQDVAWLSESKLPIRDESGEIIGLFGIGRDITERKKAQFITEKLSHQLETAVQLARIANDILDPQELTQLIVNLVRERFDFYYVGLFFVDHTPKMYSRPGEYAVLHAATGEAGRELINRKHKLKVGDNSMVGRCIATGKSCIVQQSIEKERNRFANPLLPSTRSELVLPLVSRRDIIGALDIQSTEESAFTEQDISVFEVLAALLATSIQNAFLFQKLDIELKATKRDLEFHVKDSWSKYLERK
jgi:PAS domain S-box-containing protein